MKEARSEKLRQKFISEISNFLELSAEIHRNKSDSQFRASGGQIIYCFDATVFGMFVDTSKQKWRYSVQTFNSSPWRNSPPKYWQNIQAQSSMIAAEYLLSDQLPGAKQSKVFLSPWHFEELATQLKILTRESLGNSKGANLRKQKIQRELLKKRQFLELSSDSDKAHFDPNNEILEKDIQGMKDFFPMASLDRYSATRNAASLLVECDESERLDQIHRILSGDFQARLANLLDLFDPLDNERNAIEHSAKEWYYRLAGWFAEKSRHSRTANSRRSPSSGLWTDARTIALCQFISDNLINPDQKLALVTSDTHLFKAYSEWWSSRSKQSQDFILRQSMQFTPVFNFSDVNSDLTINKNQRKEVETIFKKIEQAVDSALLPFNLSTISKHSKTVTVESKLRGREHLVAYSRLHGYDSRDPVLNFFLQGISPEWLNQRIQNFKDTADLWRRLERISIGFFTDLVNKRLEDDALSTGKGNRGGPTEVYSDSAISFLSKTIDNIASNVRSNSIPIALAYIEKKLNEYGNLPRRVPATIWYKVSDRFIVNDIFMNFRVSELVEDTKSFLYEKSEAHFVFAAGAAMHARDWWAAADFAEQAITVVNTSSLADETTVEVLFVAASAQRFKLASIPSVSQNSFDESSRENLKSDCYNRALELLDECFAIESKISYRCLSMARYHSEIGALNLFRATGLFSQIVRAKESENIQIWSGDRYLIRSREALMKAVSLLPDEGSVSQEEFFDSVQHHIFHNLAGLEVLRFLASPDDFELDPEIIRSFDPVINKMLQVEKKVPALMCEWIAFCLIYKYADLSLLPELERNLSKANVDTSLALDWELASFISNYVGRITMYSQEGRSNFEDQERA